MAGWAALWEVAADQHGYVTVEQSEEAGVTYDALKQAAWRGHIERPVRGIYRLPTVPASGHDLEALAVLWTRDPAAALGSRSAFSLETCKVIYPHACMASAMFACPSGNLDRHANHIVVSLIEDSTQDQSPV